MPTVRDIFPVHFLRATSLIAPQDFRIEGWHEEFSFGKNGYVLDLEGGNKLRLSSETLANDIEAALSETDLDRWIGRTIKIYKVPKPIKDKDTGQDKIVDMFRAAASEQDVKPGSAKGAAALNGVVASARNSDMDDDIPY